jgi:hypothetical protein
MKTSKNILTATVLAVTAMSLSSCYIRISDNMKLQLKNELRYKLSECDMKIDTATCRPGVFHAIDIEDGIDDVLIIQTEDETKAEVIAYEIMAGSIELVNDEGVLKIGLRHNTANIYGPIQIRVYTPSLSSVSSNGNSGDIRISEFKGDSLNIETSGSGDIHAFGLDIAGKLTVKGTGGGDHEFRHVSAKEMIIEKEGLGDGTYDDLDVGFLDLTSTGSGHATFTGKAGSAILRNTGSGNIDASGLKTGKVDTKENGSGVITVYR